MERDPSLDTLLELDGQVLVLDPKTNHWVRFIVHRIPPSEAKPHGLDYSLTLHGPDGDRLVGFDNAHPVRAQAGPGGRPQGAHDHGHRLRTVLERRRRGLATRRSVGVKTLKVGIASAEDMKARTMAIARGELKPASGDPKVWFTSPESFARVLSNPNRALLATIAATHPASLQELADSTGRKTSNLSRTLKTMARYGFVTLQRGERGKLRPEVPYRTISLELSLGG